MKNLRKLIENYQLSGTKKEQSLAVAELELSSNWMFKIENKIKFKCLKFKKHMIGDGTQAIEFFKNGLKISVLKGKYFYSNGVNTYEIAFLKDDSIITTELLNNNETLGYLTKEEVEKYMIAGQNL